MLEIAPLVDLFFKELPWDQRLAAIAAFGYRQIETWQGGDPSELKAIRQAGDACGIKLVSVVVNGPNDETVAPVRAENIDGFVERVDRYSDYALAAGCEQGIVTTGPIAGGRGYDAQRRALVDALRAAADKVAGKGFRINLEPLNTEVDHAGYFLDNPRDAVAIVKEVGRPNVRLLYDIYHMTIMSGNQTMFLEHNLEWIGHFHLAGTPGRHEPFLGETAYPFLLHRIDAAGYRGAFGLEYKPTLSPEESLKKTWDYLTTPPEK